MNNNDPSHFTDIALSNTRSTLLHKKLTGNNELCECTSITRKALRSVADYGILLLDINVELRREEIHDRNGRTAYARGCISHSQSIRVHSQKVHFSRQIRRRQGRRTLACQTRGPQKLRRGPHQTQEQINKASVCWQATIENLVAVSPHLTDWNPRRCRLRFRYPVLSIHGRIKKFKTVLCKAWAARERWNAHE